MKDGRCKINSTGVMKKKYLRLEITEETKSEMWGDKTQGYENDGEDISGKGENESKGG